MNEYPITLNDVKRFLATKREDEELDRCGNAKHCLLTDTLNWLYPLQQPWRVDIGSYTYSRSDERFYLTRPLDFLRTAFDHADSQFNAPVTKRQLRQYLIWLSTQQEYVTEPAKMPFTVEDLFDEIPSIHTPAILALLVQYGKVMELDITEYVVYASPAHPMGTWANIPHAIYMSTNTQRYYSYVAVPESLAQETITRYSLVFISVPEKRVG